MCDRSRWKPRSYCYSTKNIKSVSNTKWERQIPKEKNYWNQFCQEQETKLTVRNSYPNLTLFPLTHKYHFGHNHEVCNNVDQSVHEKNPLAESQFNIPSFELKSFSKENRIDNISELVLPKITISSSTLSEKSIKMFNTREKEFEKTITENVSSVTASSSQFCTNDQTAISEDIKNRKIYSRKDCPVHRNEPPTRIFDVDIEKYLVNSNQKDGQLPTKKACKICQRKTSERTATSVGNYLDDGKLSNNLNSNQESLKMVSKVPELNDTDLKHNSSKLTIDNVNDLRLWYDLQKKAQDKNFLIDTNLDARKRKCVPKNKSEYLVTKLSKYIKKRRKSSVDSDLQKYSLRYAHKALKCVISNNKLHNDPTTYEAKNQISPSSEKCERKLVNASTSLQFLLSLDLELGNNLKNHSSTSANFLNRLPKLSYFPRKNQDRCLCCLYKSLDKIIESGREDIHKITKCRTPMQNVSIDSDSSDITLPVLKDNQNQIDDSIKITESNIMIINEKKFDSSEMEKIKEKTPELHRKTTAAEITKTKERTSEGKKIDVKTISKLSERSRASSSCSSSEEERSSIAFPEDNSKNSKYRAPCHAPTIFCHSLEPLRALKTKKSISLQARIASNESTVISTLEDQEKIKSTTLEAKQQEKPSSKDPKSEIDSASVKKILTKVKSVSENLIAKSENVAKEKGRVLRRGSSCVNLEAILRDFARDGKLDSLIEDDSEKLSQAQFLFSTEEIETVLRDLEEENTSAINILTTLCDMFLHRILESNNIDKKQAKLIKLLVKLLVDSKRYLNPDKFPSDLIFSSSQFLPSQRPLLNAERLKLILPPDSYNLIAPLLGMPEYHPRVPYKMPRIQSIMELVKKQTSDESDSSQETGDELIVHPPSVKVDTIMHDNLQATLSNPYALFLKKERRKVITWRPLTEEDLKGYDPEATLRMRADKVTMKICKDFCEWLRSLGGAERDIDEMVIKDMFEISFSADACKATQITVKEMATVPTDVAAARLCHGSSVLEMTRKQLHRDAEAEGKPKCTLAFGTSMPIDLLFLPPKNRVHEKWLECKNVPQDLESMATVWEGITDLDSVQGFRNWLANYPEVSPPEILTQLPKKKAMRKKNEDLDDLENEEK